MPPRSPDARAPRRTPPIPQGPSRRRRAPRVSRLLGPLLLAPFLLLPFLPAPSLAEAAPGRILIGLAPGADFGALEPLHRALGARLVRTLPGSRIAIVDAPRPDLARARYAAHPSSAWAERDQPVWLPGRSPAERQAADPSSVAGSAPSPGAVLQLATLSRRSLRPARPSRPAGRDATYPNDPLFDLQWHHETIGSATAWDFGRAHEVTIAIVDTGVECDHPDLAGACVEGYDYYNDDPDPRDDNQHGTIEAGVAAAVTDNALGVAGLAWGARIMPLKAMSASGQGSFSAIVSSIEHAADHGAQVISLSLGAQQGSEALQAAVAYAAGRGVFLAAAGGNGGQGPHYPAAYPEVVGVAGTKPDDSHPPFTTGPHIEIAAPGWDIQTTTLTTEGGYARHHGTSEATPLVAALAALLIEQHPDWSVAQIRQRIIDSAVDLGQPGWDEVFGWGRID
ncbi:MAG: S8 family serine peptidase, partial [Chloroflexi bacterium]|nr:S8 family serine peptidase [Chloroflexota bacterium]